MIPGEPCSVRATILANDPLMEGIFRLLLRLPPAWGPPAPGQFVQVECPPAECFGLCRPFSLAGFEAGPEGARLTILYGIGGKRTRALCDLPAGAPLRLFGPLGKPFTLLPARDPVLVGGGRGIAPLRLAAEAWKVEQPRGRIIYGVRAAAQEIPFPSWPYRCDLASEDGLRGTAGTVIDVLDRLWREGEISSGSSALYACGPNPMLRALAGWAQPKKIPCQVSIETRFGCGFGICAGCAVPRAGGADAGFSRYALACVEGPVMPAEEIDWEAFEE